MKTILMLLLSFTATAQCETNRIANSYLALPSFFGLYFTGQCIEGNISDTTICVKVARQSVGQVASFSYSSPNGQPAFVTNVNQYDSDCIIIENSPLVYPGSDTVTVCYDIQAALIDNFCPYMVLSGGLSIDWGGFTAYFSDGQIKFIWLTLSNIGTKHFEIIHSLDAISWEVIALVSPYNTTSSQTSEYRLNLPFNQGGDHYFSVRELDYDGNYSSVPVTSFVKIPYPSSDNGGFDILGRRVNSNEFMYYVGGR